MRKTILASSLLVCGCVVALVLAEIFLRVYSVYSFSDYTPSNQKAFLYHHEDIGWMRKDPQRYWRFNSGTFEMASSEVGEVTTFRINQDGIRHSGPVVPKQKGVRRIVCLGDSTTFGVDLQDVFTYPSQLEKKLNDGTDGFHYEVINAGVPGYTTYQGTQFLREKYSAWAPDIITIYFGENDNYDVKRFYQELDNNGMKKVDLFLRRTLRTYSFVKKITQSLHIGLDAAVHKAERAEAFIDHLEALIDFAQEKNIRAYLVTYPTYNEVFGDAPHAYNARIRESAAKYNVELVDLVALFRAEKDKKLFRDNLHHTPQGSELVANALFSALREKER